MMTRTVSIALLVGLAAVTARESHAEERELRCGVLLAPSSTPLRDTVLDQNRVACGQDGFGVGLRALATRDSEDHLGALASSAFLDYRYLHLSGFEFSVGAALAHYRIPDSEAFGDGELTLGPVSVGALRPRKSSWWGVPAVVGHAFRLELPLTDRDYRSVTVAASPALLVTLLPSDVLRIHGRIAGLLWSIVPESGADSQAALLMSSDVAVSPFSWAALTGGVEAQAGWYELGLDHVQARAGLRFRAGANGAIELTAGYVLAGKELNDVAAWLGYRRGVGPKPKSKRSKLQDWAR